MLHLGLLLLVAFSGGRQDGVDSSDTPITQVVMLESRHADHRDGSRSAPLEPAVPAINIGDQLEPQSIPAPSLLPEIDTSADEPDVAPPPNIIDSSDPVLTTAIELPSTFVMPPAQASELLQHIERLADELKKKPRVQSTWNQDGKQYNAELVLERASNGLELDRVIAEVSAEDRGKRLRTLVLLKRLSFSHFTQLVDKWDPWVQMHDDEIVGRTHINSQFNVLDDSQARPTLLGKVSTAARRFNMQSIGRGRETEVFREGIETRAGRIAMPMPENPSEWARRDRNARMHEFPDDTRIRFFADGSYWWRDSKSVTSQYHNDPSEHPVYFVAARGVTLYVQGVVAGKVLVYSPQRIVVEGSLTYAHDPRDVPDSGDYLGLVCDKDIEIAPARVTGPGDVFINAALFAKRRFVVTDIDHPDPATLRIYGSLAAGSLTASEPRYATKIEYDGRFEQLRPPGFPSTNRFAAEDWDREWTEVPEQTSSDSF